MNIIANNFFDTNKNPVEGVSGSFELRAYASSESGIVEVSEILDTYTFLSDADGKASAEVTKVLYNTSLIKFFKYYGQRFSIGLEILGKTDKVQIYDSINEKYLTYAPSIIKYNFSATEVNFAFDESGNLSMSEEIVNTKSIILTEATAISFESLRTNYIQVQRDYEAVKKEYEETLKSTNDIVLSKKEAYHPDNFKYVITRLLELQIGTLEPGIEFASEAKLTFEENILKDINRLINRLSEIHPEISIDSGEGQPYSTSRT
jgi:hypothetical protein